MTFTREPSATDYDPHAADEYIRSRIADSGCSDPPDAWDTRSAGEELLDYMEAHGVAGFDDVPDGIVMGLLDRWDRRDAYSQDMAERNDWNPLW